MLLRVLILYISGYSSADAAVYVDEFTLEVAGEEYIWNPSGTTTLTSLVNWINSLDAEVYARVVQTTGNSAYSLQIFGTKTGIDNAVTFSGLYTNVEKDDPVNPIDVDTSQSADAEFTVNGVAFQRSSNSITGVIDGVTLNLISPSGDGESEVINVTRGTDNSEAVIKKLIDAYNDLMSTYKSMTANAMNSDKPGTFANNPMMLSFINEIKAKFAIGASYGSDMSNSISLGTMGVDLQRDGTLKFNTLNFFNAQADGLQEKLSQGVGVGYISSTNNLKNYLNDLIGITGNSGSLATLLSSENSQMSDLNKRQLD